MARRTSQTLQASGGIPSPSWSITSGSLPLGLTLASTDVISGIPTASGTFSFNITAADKGSPQQDANSRTRCPLRLRQAESLKISDRGTDRRRVWARPIRSP